MDKQTLISALYDIKTDVIKEQEEEVKRKNNLSEEPFDLTRHTISSLIKRIRDNKEYYEVADSDDKKTANIKTIFKLILDKDENLIYRLWDKNYIFPWDPDFLPRRLCISLHPLLFMKDVVEAYAMFDVNTIVALIEK